MDQCSGGKGSAVLARGVSVSECIECGITGSKRHAFCIQTDEMCESARARPMKFLGSTSSRAVNPSRRPYLAENWPRAERSRSARS